MCIQIKILKLMIKVIFNPADKYFDELIIKNRWLIQYIIYVNRKGLYNGTSYQYQYFISEYSE